MDPMTREALVYIQKAMGEMFALMALEQPTEAQAVYDPARFHELEAQIASARSAAIPRALGHLSAAGSLVPKDQKDLKKAIQMIEAWIHNQERMSVLANLADTTSRNWRAEYQDCVMKNRRYGADIDKSLERLAKKIGFVYDESGIRL